METSSAANAEHIQKVTTNKEIIVERKRVLCVINKPLSPAVEPRGRKPGLILLSIMAAAEVGSNALDRRSVGGASRA